MQIILVIGKICIKYSMERVYWIQCKSFCHPFCSGFSERACSDCHYWRRSFSVLKYRDCWEHGSSIVSASTLLTRGTNLSKPLSKNLFPYFFLDATSAFSTFPSIALLLCVAVCANFTIHKDILQAGWAQLQSTEWFLTCWYTQR